MNDNELIYLYSNESNELAFNFLYQKYEQQTLFLCRKILARFFAIPLELDDLKTSFYFTFFESIYKFFINKK